MFKNKPKAINFNITGIKCDAPNCGWSDNEAVFDPIKWLNEPCPDCGANLFTPADYIAHKKMLQIAAIINFILWPFVWGKPKVKEFKLEMNGTGNIKLKDKP